ncbi:MAG: carboxypeptidase-like regulatory domain-containing protein [Clostridia bacterium]|nr:carboxypeptidase-like regulatory domain-containing protein [Clostridia bacterium]
MFVKVNTEYLISLLVVDSNGNRIINDLPVVIIKNLQNNSYWNGMFWQPTISEIILNHISDGVYKTEFTPDAVGLYEITTKSDLYGINKVEILEVYDTNIVQYNWKIGIPFTAKYTNIGGSDTPLITICDTKNNLYWNESKWVSNPTNIEMVSNGGDVYSYDFTPTHEAEYSIFMRSTDNAEIFYILSVSEEAEAIQPIIINNSVFKNQDGTDSTILDERNNPINGAKITCYNVLTKEVEARCVSNIKGEWSMAIKPGKYMFVFEKEGYMSVTFERSVM